MIAALICIAAILLDRLLGEPPRYHPLIGFGQLVNWTEARLHPGSQSATWIAGGCGLLAVLVLTLPFVMLTAGLSSGLGWPVEVIVLYLAVGGGSLTRHALEVYQPLSAGELEQARERVARIVSRDTGELNQQQVSAATIESVLENGCDAVFGALFWFVVAGAPGAMVYRLVNTLDAMWGYRTERYRYFGWAAARLDDVLNWIPAQLTALSYTLVGQTSTAWRCWWRQGGRWKSLNAGSVMAAGAGALGVCLGGPAPYHGHWSNTRPILGAGAAPSPKDIRQALNLLDRALLLWLLVILIGGMV